MKNRFFYQKLAFLMLVVYLGFSCSDEIDRPVFPISATIFHSVKDKQVAFTALTHSAVSWQWDFGDGKTSTEQNPVHVYEKGGYYNAILTATDQAGTTAKDTVSLALALSPINYLTGNPNAPGYKGKTWRLTKNHSSKDNFCNPNLLFTPMDPKIPSLPAGAFGTYLGIPEIYDDEFTFYYDGSYRHDLKSDGASMAGLVYASLLAQQGKTTILKKTGKAVFGADILATATYTPVNNAKFVFKESEDFTTTTLPNFATGAVNGVPVITYPKAMSIDFPNTTEFMGIMDFQRKVLVQEINDNSMRVAMFITLDPKAIVSTNPLVTLSTTALVLTFEVVK
jgi:PKD repeat protein